MSQQKTASTYRNRYSVAYKIQIVQEIENGLISIRSASKLYGVPPTTLTDWVKKYGINTQIDKVVYTMTHAEERELLVLRKENKRLAKALDDSHLQNMALESLIEVADEKYGLTLKKNFGSQLAQELKRKLKQSDSEGQE